MRLRLLLRGIQEIWQPSCQQEENSNLNTLGLSIAVFLKEVTVSESRLPHLYSLSANNVLMTVNDPLISCCSHGEQTLQMLAIDFAPAPTFQISLQFTDQSFPLRMRYRNVGGHAI